MTGPSSLSLPIRVVEWARDSGGEGLVNAAEHAYYTITAPKAGGPSLSQLPDIGQGGPAGALSATPPHISLAIPRALHGEGVWRRASKTFAGMQPILVTVFRPEAAYPRQLAYVAWMNRSMTHMELYAGRVRPPMSGSRGPMDVPRALRSHLVATFNSGFVYKDCKGGFAIHGRTILPMASGQGTLIERTDGTMDVQKWSGGSAVASDVVLARQNLPLIVDGGRLNPTLGDGSRWGATLGNAVRVWRTAVGVDSLGNLIYLAAPGQTAASLAAAMIRAGAVRAMQMDINAYWPSFITYGRPGGRSPDKLVPNANQPATRYLHPDDTDFFAVYAAPAAR